MAYKDSLFRSIFGNEKSALGLYNAVHGTSLRAEETEVEIATLGEILWTSGKNDLAFTLGGALVVIVEHQSSINENMPYRMLQYVCRLFENAIEDKNSVYRRARVMRRRPRFIIFYNGAAPFPDRKTMLLSESYLPALAGYDGIALELEIEVYNINDGRNSAILEACADLKGYAFFVARARFHERDLKAQGGLTSKEITIEAIRRAIRDCKDAGLLTEYWDKLTNEEMNMLANDWNMETALEVRGEEEFERGVEKGRESGRMEIAMNALAEGLPLGVIQKLTGLDTQTITGLSQRAP